MGRLLRKDIKQDYIAVGRLLRKDKTGLYSCGLLRKDIKQDYIAVVRLLRKDIKQEYKAAVRLLFLSLLPTCYFHRPFTIQCNTNTNTLLILKKTIQLSASDK